MRRLTGEDTQFIFRENRVEHQHTIKVVVVDPSTAHEEPTYEAFREGVRSAIPQAEPFRWRLVKVPFRLGHPWWIEAGELDVDYHVRRATAPRPGGSRELAEVISMIASTGLERDRPLWQAWMVDGLEGDRVAYVMKVHHALADGLATAQLMLDLLDATDDAPPPEPGGSPPGEAEPGKPWLVRDGLTHGGRIVSRLPRLASDSLRWARAARRQNRGPHPLARSFAVDRVRWNAPLTPHRWFAYETLSLPELRRVKDHFGVTLNDVFLAIVAGGTRTYLDRCGELPPVDLTASIPVSTRTPEEARDWGNRVTLWSVALATSTADPVDRLHLIAERTRRARRAREQRSVSLQHDYLEPWRLWTILVNWLPAPMAHLSGRATYSLIASNVPGPRSPLYANGARVTEVISMGPLVKDIGLNITAWSYVDSFTIGLVACREHVPDIWELARALAGAADELIDRAGARPSTSTAR